MSYYFAVVGTQDNPLFEHEFGTSKQGGDGQSRFNEQVRHLNQFILHSSLDVVEEVQWAHGQMYAQHTPNHPPFFFFLLLPFHFPSIQLGRWGSEHLLTEMAIRRKGTSKS